MSYGEADSHPSGFEQGNTGYSGAPMWKIKLQTQQYRAVVEAAQAARLEETKKAEEKKEDIFEKPGPKILVDAYVVRSSKGQQLVRHMLVKDLRKAASVMHMEMPTEGIFNDKGGQRALFALFDGQSAESPGPMAAEICCRHVLGKILRNLLSLPAANCTAVFIKAALLKTFEDLEKELQVAQINERCGAALALVIGDYLFTAVLGNCGAVLFQSSGSTGSAKGTLQWSSTPLSTAASQAPPGPGQILGTPEVKGTQMEGEPFFVLTGCPTSKLVDVQEQGEICASFIRRPRASAGEIASRAGKNEGAGDCAAVVAYVKQPEEDKPGQPAAKKLKIQQQQSQMDSVRLRHVVVRYKAEKGAINPMNNKPVTRSREEAEALLRDALTELLKDGEHIGDSKFAAQVTPQMLKVFRATSECKTSIKGGSNCGDLGWLSKKELQRMGKEGFAEQVFGLGIAEWSDLVFTIEGAHLIMRMA
eukprot:TRINITY_DN55776_c0_g1_i1.p1 TRINITY_DN55776_c0_g1~~TRINITY_DN55776_c0_g1_i1.p1  ORF type:complete len:476 (-),score=97.19 TRINITY_DN55776_c0_g1_i1:134-1561(-)